MNWVDRMVLIAVLILQGFIFRMEYAVFTMRINDAPVAKICSEIIKNVGSENEDHPRAARTLKNKTQVQKAKKLTCRRIASNKKGVKTPRRND